MSRRSLCRLLPFLVLTACGEPADISLGRVFLNLFPLSARGQAPLDGVERITVHSGRQLASEWRLGDAATGLGQLEPGRDHWLEVAGYDGGSLAAWGFCPPLRLQHQVQQLVCYVTRSDAAVARLGSPVVDFEVGLTGAELPSSLRQGGMTAALAWTAEHLIVQVDVSDDKVITTASELLDGDMLVLVIDSQGDSRPGTRDWNDIALALRPTDAILLYGPPAPPGTPGIVQRFANLGAGFRALVLIPWPRLGLGGPPDGPLELGLAVELRDQDEPGGTQTITRWPATWEPGPDVSYHAAGSGAVVLATRALDARRVTSGSVGIDADLSAFLQAGAVTLSTALPGADPAKLYALYDDQALMLAVSIADADLCSDQAVGSDRVELIIAPPGSGAYHARYDLSGQAPDYELLGGGTWSASGAYYRIDMLGPWPAGGCVASDSGYTLTVRLPWRALGYGALAPAFGEVLGFELVVFDVDRGAAATTRTLLGTELPGPDSPVAALRLFEF